MIRSRLSKFSGVAALACLAVADAAAADPPVRQLATTVSLGAAVVWELLEPGSDTTLTVVGPDVAISLASETGGPPVLDLRRPDGSPLPDGTYVWQLSESFGGINDLVYDPENGRTGVPPDRAPERVDLNGWTQSGSFVITGGVVVDGGREETQDRHDRKADS